MELSLQKLQRNSRRFKVACVPLMFALVLPNAQAKEAKDKDLAEYGKEAARFINVTGTVKDSKGEPLPGVTVTIKGTKTSTATDINGVFRLNLPTGNETLVFKFLGFESKEVKPSGSSGLTIILEESTSTLNEVVVTGYGEKKRSEIVGSVATITGEELQDIPAPNIAGALRNRIAGVGISQASGRPGAGISINIRNSTVSSTAEQKGATDQPLYIIDGIVVSKDDFDNLDASMVENIAILKDASAAIYGAAGAKGVVLVSTKRGKQGKPSISYNGYVGVSDATRMPDMMSGYDLALLLNETYRMQNAPQSDYFSNSDLETIKAQNYDSWLNQLWKSSTTQRHNLSISGGSDKITFFVGGSYQNEDGNYAGMKQDKYSFRSGVTATIVDGLKADINFNVDRRVRKSNNDLSNETDNNFFASMVSIPRWVPMTINDLPIFYDARGTSFRHPLAIMNSGFYDNRRTQGYRINASVTYEPKFIKGLSAKLQISQGGTNSNNNVYTAPYDVYKFVTTGNNNLLYTDQPVAGDAYISPVVSPATARLHPTLGRSDSYQGFFTLKYGNTFGLHSFDVTIGGEQTVSDSEDLSVYWVGQNIPGIDDWWAFNAASLTRHSRYIYETTKRSFFGRFNYDIDKKYLLEAVARLDASSNFARGNRWGLSPSIGLGWIVSKEDFFKDNISFINFLKIKVNYGIAGDDRVSERLWQDRYTVDATNGYLFGTTNNGTGINPSVFPNTMITWEKKKTFNAGVEMSMLNNKIDLGVEVFRNHTFDGFDQGADNMYPLYAGFKAPVVNYREYYNWGTEFTLGYKAKIARQVNVSTSVNFAYGNSVVDKMIYAPGNLKNDDAFSGESNWLATQFGTDPRKWNTGNMGYKTNGMFRTQAEVDAFLAENPNYKINGNVPQPGWLQYVDVNGDGIVNAGDKIPLFENPNPFFSSGISLNVSYKALSLSTSIYAKLGGKVFYDSQATVKPDKITNVLTFWNDRWTSDNPMEGRFPRFDDPLINSRSDFWAVDGTTIRVNNMTLSYKVPTKIAAKMGLGGARILATGNNLWTIVNPYEYKDPYSSSAYNYPVIRTISLGLSVNL